MSDYIHCFKCGEVHHIDVVCKSKTPSLDIRE